MNFFSMPIAALVCMALPVLGQSLKEDFSTYASESDGNPNWAIQDVGWQVINGAYEGSAGNSVWRAVPYASSFEFGCDITVLEQGKGDWLTAGIGIYADEKNYWALNLTVAPEKMQRVHSVEMQEMLAGQWLAQGQAETHLDALAGKGHNFNWQTGQTYRLEVALTSSNVTGRILSKTEEVSRFGYRLNSKIKSVAAGRPFVRASGLLTRFDNASVKITQPAKEPEIAQRKIPLWISREGPVDGKATGFFHAEEIKGRWWLIDPEGKLFFDVGTDHVSYRGHWCEKLGYAPYHRNMQSKYGSEEAWGKSTLERLKQWGFNTLPAGHSPSLRHQGMPHLLFASFGAGFARRAYICEPIHWTGFPDVFDPRWESYCRLVARKMAAESMGDPWCFGTFLDNELEWYGKKGHLVDEVFRGAPNQAAKKALFQWLAKRFGNIDGLNRSLGTRYQDESAFLASTNVPPSSDTLTSVRNDFLTLIAERYFSVAAGAMKQADPQHMVLGCRFAGQTPEPVLAAAGKYNDVFTFNTYPRIDFENAWLPDGTDATIEHAVKQIADYYAAARKPVIITEWGFPALDSGLPCMHGAGMRVDTQEQKAACYKIFASQMADLPFVVGYHYFMWADEPAAGISTSFPEDSNYGLVNEQDEPYQTLVSVATKVNRNATARHASSMTSGFLQMRAEQNAIVINNTNSIPSQARLHTMTQDGSSIESVYLNPGQTRRIPMSASKPWSAELFNWDTTKTRMAGGINTARSVVNFSEDVLTNVPGVLEDASVIPFFFTNMPPGNPITLPNLVSQWKPFDVMDFSSSTVTWSSGKKGGGLFNNVRAGTLTLGKVLFATHQNIDGKDQWTGADDVSQLQYQDQPDAWVIEATVSHPPSKSGPAGFQARVRAVVFKQLDLVMVRPLWVENTDTRPWTLVEAYWFCRPSIGGSTENDVIGGPKVPNYYRSAQFFTDTKLGGCFGAFNQPEGWRVAFWATPQEGIHPDARYAVNTDVRPGQKWTPDTVPYLWIFASKNADAWKDLSRKERQCSRYLVTGNQNGR